MALAILDTLQVELLALDEESLQLHFKDLVRRADPLKVVSRALLINLAQKPLESANCFIL